MKYLRSLALLLLIFLFPVVTWAEEIKLPPENLPQLIDAALAGNPEVKSSQSRWQMFANKAKQAASLEDPMFMLKLQNLVAREPFSFGGSDPQTAKVIGISQQLPFWGKRDIRQEMAKHEAESYRWSIEERKLELARMVKETYYQIWATDKSLEIVAKNLQLLGDFVTIAESKYSVGQGVQQDIYKAGLEKSKMLDMQITLKQQRKSLEANLNYLLYRPGNTPVGPIADFSLPKITQSAEQLKYLAEEKRPQMKSLSELVSKGQAGHRLAEKEYWPDFNLSFEYMFREKVDNDMVKDPGYNMFTVGVTFNLPFQQEKRRAMVAESTSETSMATEELNALRNTISYTINDTLAQMDRRWRLVELYKGGIIPQAEQSLESAVISYRVSKVDFLTLLDGRMNLFNYERELYESQAEYMMKLAQLEAAVGGDITVATAPPVAAQPPTAPQAVAPAEPATPPQTPADEHSKHH
ncbi:TolC family protein [Geobacter hydrogenophilus]|uniref:RND transporter n=1 Tax=Geobacter hydrogenophilus TaxID=40983 RepID=A0A9W6LD37_9BACT|nr:TolC family protein [Geobacter hydrogenophilus]MBT0895278.1 TolC family protein [Geobacter hydrogenophilus]GLI39507.1 RND transporter [Geobacter hydrogenophilus]